MSNEPLPIDPYELRDGRAEFWATVAAAVSPKEFAADDIERQAPPDIGAYSSPGGFWHLPLSGGDRGIG